MRTCLVFFLTIMLSLNAAYAASVGVCAALEQTSSHAAHFAHHGHEDSDEYAHDNSQVSADEAGKVTAVSGHHHDHVHPSFSVILPCNMGIVPLIEPHSLVATPASVFVSAPQALIEYPPKATLA